jgi:putative NIF3 family GTP cyclohydrolase 1 type 2
MEYGVSAALGDRLGLIDCGFFLPEASGIGFGMAGYLPKKSTLGAFIESVKSNLALDALRYVGDPSAMVKKVVVMGGSGAEFMTEALKQSADVFVSGDFKYHDAQTANELGLPIIDAGHFGTEAVVMEPFMKKLTESIGEMEFLLSEKMLDFWSYR